jgi:hypothetical protein
VTLARACRPRASAYCRCAVRRLPPAHRSSASRPCQGTRGEAEREILIQSCCRNVHAPSLDPTRRNTVHQGNELPLCDHGRRSWPEMQALIRAYHRGGVLLTAGSDEPNSWIVPGPSLDTELELLTEAGRHQGYEESRRPVARPRSEVSRAEVLTADPSWPRVARVRKEAVLASERTRWVVIPNVPLRVRPRLGGVRPTACDPPSRPTRRDGWRDRHSPLHRGFRKKFSHRSARKARSV